MKDSNRITEYIPQREPMVMVSELCSVTETNVKTKLFIANNNIFCKDGFFQEPGLIENIAQSAAAMTGFNAIKNNEEVKRGFIGSINKLNIYNLPKSGIEIETEITIINEVMNVHIIEGIVRQNYIIMAECEMKIFLEE